MRNVECKDRESVLRSQDQALLEALKRHTQNCAMCAQELRWWNDISAAAREMHRNWDSPALWPRIQQALATESQAGHPRPRAWSLSQLWRSAPSWSLGAALVSLLVLTASGGWILMHRPAPLLAPEAQRRLLTEQALREVEKSEAAYVASIQKLEALAGPKIESPGTPLLASYREKLLLLDTAIAECRTQVLQNRGSPQLRQELLSMYREKQQTLQEVIREE